MFSKFFNFISNVFEPFRRNRQPGETVKRKRSVTDENDALEEGPTAHKRSRPCNVLTDSNFDLKNSNTATDLLPVFRFKKPGQPFIHELVKEPKTAAKENWIGTQGTEMKPTMSPASKKKFKAPSHCRSPVRRPSRPISLLDNDDDEPKYIKTLVVTPKAAQPPNPMPRKFQKKFQKPGESSGTSGRPSAPFNTPRSLNKNSRALNSFMKQYSVSRYDLDCKMMYKALLGSILKDPAKYPHFAPVNPSPSSSSVDLITLEESDDDVVEVSSFTLHPNVSLRDNRRTPKRSRPRVLDKIDLTDTPNPSSTTPVATVDITSDDDDDVQVVESPSSLANVPKLNTLEEALKKIPITQGNWINELTTNYKDMRAKRVLRRDKLEKECEALFKYSEHKVEELLAKEIKEHMKISESLVIDVEDEEEEEVEAVETVLPELTPTMLNKINAAMNPTLDQNQTMSVKFGYTIKRRDLRTLLGLNWLNDEVINFYMSLLMERSKQKDYPSVYAFNTFFYEKISNAGHAGVRRWTRKVDIFSHDLIIVPVHLSVHWCMASIDLKKKTINYYDSMGSDNNEVMQRLLQYLKDEMKDKKNEILDTGPWTLNNVQDIPQQMNGSDCGIFSCTFAEFICRRAPFTFTQSQMPYFRKKMVWEILQGELML